MQFKLIPNKIALLSIEFVDLARRQIGKKLTSYTHCTGGLLCIRFYLVVPSKKPIHAPV